jgi:hypothetical protein
MLCLVCGCVCYVRFVTLTVTWRNDFAYWWCGKKGCHLAKFCFSQVICCMKESINIWVDYTSVIAFFQTLILFEVLFFVYHILQNQIFKGRSSLGWHRSSVSKIWAKGKVIRCYEQWNQYHLFRIFPQKGFVDGKPITEGVRCVVNNLSAKSVLAGEKLKAMYSIST